MTARFLHQRGQMLPITLNHQRWPPEDVEALWHMMPRDFTIEWVAPLHVFVIKDTLTYKRIKFEQVEGAREIPARKSFIFDEWMMAFKSLIAEAEGGIVSGQNIDPTRAP